MTEKDKREGYVREGYVQVNIDTIIFAGGFLALCVLVLLLLVWPVRDAHRAEETPAYVCERSMDESYVWSEHGYMEKVEVRERVVCRDEEA